MSLEDTYREAVAKVIDIDAALPRCAFDIQVTWTEWRTSQDVAYATWENDLKYLFPRLTRYRHAEALAGMVGSIFVADGSYGVVWERTGMPSHHGMRTLNMAEMCFMAGLDRDDLRRRMVRCQTVAARNVRQVSRVVHAFDLLAKDTERKLAAVLRKVQA